MNIEFIDVGKKPRALEILCDVLRSRKHRTWQKKHEDIMIKYLELCVELKKSYVAKEGIYQYKIICQQTYINSFEDVVRKYLEMAEEKANIAREESQASVLDVDDLDNAQTPEDILLSAVSNEDTQDRTDRVVLIPWVKFLWESYRQCLDLLKNNSRTERLYHDIAHQAFRFCIKYNRKTEFRKLCDNLHAHLDILKKQQQQQQQVGHQQQNAINLNFPESQAMHLETRLVQLDCAIQMELWQEAYKATDDIKRFGLMNLSKKPPKPQLMANYYQKLALVFWKANCPLFHSAALFRLFHLSKELRKNITAEDIQKMATKVVAATLAIPIPPNRPEIDKIVDTEENIIENHQRNLASLLGLTSSVPTRASLIKDLKRMGVLQHAFHPFQDLYRWLEIDFHPLVLCNRVQQVIDFIEKCTECPELKQYVNALKDVTIMRLLKEVSQIYQTIEFKRLLELCPFANFTYLEKMVVEAARRNDLQVRIDHRKGCLIFGTELRVSTGEELIEGPHLQSMPSEQIRKQLVNMYSALQKSRILIEPERVRNQREDIKRKIMKAYRMTAQDEHRRILNRQGIIEERKELLEQIGLRREEEERKKAEEQQQRMREAEEERIMKETEERERQRKMKQDAELKKQMAKDQLSIIKGQFAANLLENLDDEELAKLKPEDIHSKRIEQLEKERRDQLSKQRKLERKFDHLERAKRLEEIPLLKKAAEEQRVRDEDFWEQMEDERIKDIKEERILALQHRERFVRVLEDKEIFAKKIISERHSVYMKELAAFQSVVDEERKRRLQERREKRKEERRHQYYVAKEEAEKKKREEINRKIKEENEAKFALQAEKQRQRELEIEEKQKQKQLEAEEKLRQQRRELEPEDKPRMRQRDHEIDEKQRESENWRERKPDRNVERNLERRGPPTQSRADEENDWHVIEARKSDRNPERRVPTNPSRADEENDWRKDKPDRNVDRNVGRNQERSFERNVDRNFDRNTDRNSDRNPERNYERNSDRNFERNSDRNFERNADRNPDRNYDRSSNRRVPTTQSRADEENDWRREREPDRNADRRGPTTQSRPDDEKWRKSDRNQERRGPPPQSRADDNKWRDNRKPERTSDRNEWRDRNPDRRGPQTQSRADEENEWREVRKPDRNPERKEPQSRTEDDSEWHEVRKSDRGSNRRGRN